MTDQVALFELVQLDAQAYVALLTRPQEDLSQYIKEADPIIKAVANEHDAALVRYAKEFDGAELTHKTILVSETEFVSAWQQLDPELLATLELAAANIRAYHELQLPVQHGMHELAPGVHAGERILPVASAACYAPRGKGSFPSVALMTTIPAVVAGVKEVVLLTPAGPDGNVDPATVVAAQLAGVTKIAKAGGVVAVAAAAFGTESVPKCVKFEGPGSPWLAAAKRLLASWIDSRLPAGPSESIILADSTAPAHKVALDLLIESEHGPDSSVFLVTWERDFAEQVRGLVPRYLSEMGPRCQAAAQTVLTGANGGIVIAQDAQAAYKFVNDYAPEHLQIMTRDPQADLEYITNAAEVLLGEHTPGSIANYLIGPNCVLPTAGAAKVHSPLGVQDFQKRMTVAKLDEQGYAALAEHTHRFASYEGFDGHANAVSKLRDEKAN